MGVCQCYFLRMIPLAEGHMEAKKGYTMEQRSSQPNTLRQGALRTSDAIAQSIALLALVMGIALTTSFAAASAGAAAPLAYVVAALASLCLAYVIIRFTRRLASAG